jgi:hypothetical protein
MNRSYSGLGQQADCGRAKGFPAIDLLVGQPRANEFGIPKHEKIVAVRGHWMAGSSLRPAKSPPRRRIRG